MSFQPEESNIIFGGRDHAALISEFLDSIGARRKFKHEHRDHNIGYVDLITPM